MMQVGKSHVPGDLHRGVSEKWRRARKRRRDDQPRVEVGQNTIKTLPLQLLK
jgi:hypothetical protein